MARSGLLGVAVLTVFISSANADQSGFSNSGGTTLVSGSVSISSAVASPAGTITVDCPITGPTVCSGGSIAYLSNDGTQSISGSFSTGKIVESCSGGGRGGHISCGYTFNGSFDGTWTLNGVAQSIVGVTYQGFGLGHSATGATVFNSTYEPFYYSDGQQIHRTDDLQGTHLLSYGSYGSGVGQFYGVYSLALDAAGRIYIADTYNCRIVRIDDMKGTNWTAYGAGCGSGQGQFHDPAGVFVDNAGKIYITDTGNTRIVRIDDMTGANWIAYGSVGSGIGQFAGLPSSVAVDAAGHIYIADEGNRRLVRIDDMTGSNWTALTQLQPIDGYGFLFSSPNAVATDSAGGIYLADSGSIVRLEDMTGTSWSRISIGTTGTYSLAVDASGTVFTGGGGVNLIDDFAGFVTSNAFGYYVYGIVPVPLPTPRPPAVTFSPSSMSFGTHNIKTASGSQPVTIANFGGSPLNIQHILASTGFQERNNCPSDLIASESCTVNVYFEPETAGVFNGTLRISDNSGNLGTTQVVNLSGKGVAPAALVTPPNLTFPPQASNSTSAAQKAVVLSTGAGSLMVNSVTASGPFTVTNNCGGYLVGGDGCTLNVTFQPSAAGPATGTLTIVDNAGTQTVGLTGTGVSTAALVTVTPASLLFPVQLVNNKSAMQQVTVTNASGTAVANLGIIASGDFAETASCGPSIAAGKSCTISVIFTPSAAGVRTGTLNVNLSSGAQQVGLSGIGDSSGSLPRTLTLSPPTISFTGYQIGDNPSQTETVTNNGDAAIGLTSVSLGGSSTLTQENNCGAVLTPGASCSVTITFQPRALGTYNSTLVFTEGSGATDSVPVTGTCVPSS